MMVLAQFDGLETGGSVACGGRIGRGLYCVSTGRAEIEQEVDKEKSELQQLGREVDRSEQVK